MVTEVEIIIKEKSTTEVSTFLMNHSQTFLRESERKKEREHTFHVVGGRVLKVPVKS